MMALTYSYFEYLARELQNAFKGMSTKEKVVLDIILTRNNAEMHLLQDTYSKSESERMPCQVIPTPRVSRSGCGVMGGWVRISEGGSRRVLL